MLKKSFLIFLVCSLSFQVMHGVDLEVAQKLAKTNNGVTIKKGKIYIHEADQSAVFFAIGVSVFGYGAFFKLMAEAMGAHHDLELNMHAYVGLGLGGALVLWGIIKRLSSKPIFIGLDENGITFQDRQKMLWSDLKDVRVFISSIRGDLSTVTLIPKAKEGQFTSAAKELATKEIKAGDLPIKLEEFVALIEECLQNYLMPTTGNSSI